LVKYSD